MQLWSVAAGCLPEMNEEIPFIKGEYYWLEDSQESYLAGRLLNPQPTQNNDYQFEIFQTSQIVWTNKSQINGIIPSPGEVTLRTLYDDLTDSIDISEASVLWNLRQRYQIHNIYSGHSSLSPLHHFFSFLLTSLSFSLFSQLLVRS
jgi:myosin heavy subunit